MNMKLTIYDTGDPSVGIFEAIYEIECSFDIDVDNETREWFREKMFEAYKDFAEGKLYASYSDEVLI